MNQIVAISDYLRHGESIGMFILDQESTIVNANDIIKQLFTQQQLEEIVSVFLQGSMKFCMLHTQCEVEVVPIYLAHAFFVRPSMVSMKDIMGLFFLKEEINQILDSSFDGITICDSNGVLIFQNRADKELVGMNCVGKNLKELVQQGVLDHSISLKVLETGGPVNSLSKYNNGRQVFVSGIPLRDDDGLIKLVVCNTRDLTKLKQLEKENLELEEQNKRYKRELHDLKFKKEINTQMIAHDSKTIQVVERALRVAEVDSSVLILGESGVGKEGIAHLIHQHSKRNDKQMISVNCGAIPEQLLESELFGYEAGAFTGANPKGKPGIFETASGGTIFLDEIGELPLQLQAKLLRVLQEFEITRIGGTKPVRVNVRVIAATNVNLEEMVKKGLFREDLYYRLHIIPIFIPPLRERKHDIVPLVYYFLKEIQDKYGVGRTFSREALELFLENSWPGNIRELKNTVERISLMTNHPEIDVSDIENEMKTGSHIRTHDDPHEQKGDKINTTAIEILPLKQQVDYFERTIIIKTLRQYPSIRKAAKALQLDSSSLLRKMQKYRIQREIDYKEY